MELFVARTRGTARWKGLLFVYGMWFSLVWRRWNLTGMSAWQLEIVPERLGNSLLPLA